MKRFFDFIFSSIGLIVAGPFLLVVALLVWLTDFGFPLYLAPRVRKGGGVFKMVKLRSMVMNADKLGGSSTAGDDQRVTTIGKVIRKCKLDELTQLWNVFVGEMSFVGPRPQALGDASLYSEEEKRLFSVRPGITDFASIVFADEGDILEGESDPDLAYNQLIRPWKSRLGLFYIDHRNLPVDASLALVTLIGMISRKRALRCINVILKNLGASEELQEVALRRQGLEPTPPPGMSTVETRHPSSG